MLSATFCAMFGATSLTSPCSVSPFIKWGTTGVSTSSCCGSKAKRAAEPEAQSPDHKPHLLMTDHAVDSGLLLVQLCAGPADLLASPIQPPCQKLHLLL